MCVFRIFFDTVPLVLKLLKRNRFPRQSTEKRPCESRKKTIDFAETPESNRNLGASPPADLRASIILWDDGPGLSGKTKELFRSYFVHWQSASEYSGTVITIEMNLKRYRCGSFATVREHICGNRYGYLERGFTISQMMHEDTHRRFT
jgi:hypothetical protein